MLTIKLKSIGVRVYVGLEFSLVEMFRFFGC